MDAHPVDIGQGAVDEGFEDGKGFIRRHPRLLNEPKRHAHKRHEKIRCHNGGCMIQRFAGSDDLQGGGFEVPGHPIGRQNGRCVSLDGDPDSPEWIVGKFNRGKTLERMHRAD